MSAPILSGAEIELGGKKWILPPLNAAAVRQYGDKIKAIGVGQLPDLVLVSDLTFLALSRNYPTQITQVDCDVWVDYGNVFDIWLELLNVSGLVASAEKMTRRVEATMNGKV